MALAGTRPPDRRGVVLVKGAAGLGNRLLSLLSAILYAKLAGRGVVVDWRDGLYAEPGVDAFPLLFRSSVVSICERDPLAGSVSPWMWDHRLHWTVGEVIEAMGNSGTVHCPFAGGLYSFDPAHLGHPEDVLVMWSYVSIIGKLRRHLTGRWQEWGAIGDDGLVTKLLHENLEMHPEIVACAEKVRRTWPERPRIGVHVRNTDRTTNVRRLGRQLEALVAREPDAAIFLATDSARVEDDFRRRHPRVLTVPKWFPPSGPLHLRRSGCPDRVAMARASLVEMQLLIGCDHLIFNSDSSFSLIAALWRQRSQRKAIDVGPAACLPQWMRDPAWRTFNALKWAAWLPRARRHLRMQRTRELAQSLATR